MSASTRHDPAVSWRQLRADLWTATRDGVPLGTIERGRRSTVVDVDGAVVGRFEALEAAMGALSGDRPAHRSRPVRAGVERTLFGVTGAFGIGAVAVVGYAIAAGLFQALVRPPRGAGRAGPTPTVARCEWWSSERRATWAAPCCVG